MSLSNIKSPKAERGFTIVELLIVIVVIGILAAIVIVAYNGVTNNARNNNNRAQASQLQKIAETLNAEEGIYPSGTTTAALTTSFNSGDTAKIPAGVTITYHSGADPAYATVLSAAEDSRYLVEPCTGGLKVYYPVRGDNTVATLVAGQATGC